MIPLFTDTSGTAQAVSFPGQWDYVQRGLLQNLNQAATYWGACDKPMKTNQFMVRLLDCLNVQYDLPLEKFYRYIDDKALTYAQAMGLTTSLSKGKAYRGVFYSPDNTEFLIGVDDDLSAPTVDAQWQTVSAVKVIQHPKSDLKMVLPTAERYSEESGLCVSTIHIPMLAIQYRAYINDRLANYGGNYSPHDFIERYVLPNMLASQAEIALFNRVIKLFGGRRRLDNLTSHRTPFNMVDMDARMDHVLEKVVENFAFVDPTFDKILANIPTLFYRDSRAMLKLPDVAPTSQIEWLLVAARLKQYSFLLDVADDKAMAANSGDIQQLVRVFRNNGVFQMLMTMMTPEGSYEMVAYTDNIFEVSGLAAP